MNRLGTIAISLAGVLALNAGLRAATLTATNNPLPRNPLAPIVAQNNPLPGNPYAPIVARNIFGLLPPEAPPDPALEAAKNLPKITPTGIMGVFGNWQVLFKVADGTTAKPGQPGQPAKDDFYILSQGQRQDDIEVLKIDEKKGIVTFDNHGTTQELPLAAAAGTGGGPAAPSSPGGMKPSMAPSAPSGGPGGGPGGFTRFGAGSGNNGGNPNANPGSNDGPGGPNASMDNGNSMQSRIYQPPASSMTAEETVIATEAQRLQYQQQGSPLANLLPPTPLTKFNTPGENADQ
jgi:hypothetical protein